MLFIPHSSVKISLNLLICSNSLNRTSYEKIVEGIAIEGRGFFEWLNFGGEATVLLDFCIYNRA